MIVFNFGPLSKNELTIRFDVDGAGEFLSGILEISKDLSRSITINCFEYSRRELGAAQIELRREEEERLEFSGRRLTLGVSGEACEYAEFLLKRFLEVGDFSPSEFYGFSRKGRKYNTQVFFVKLNPLELGISSNAEN